jgi:alpha-N-arabinofuranosidase
LPNIRTPKEKWYELTDNSLIIDARPTSISEAGNPSFIGRRLQHSNAEMTIAVKLEDSKEMEAGLVAFQNEKFYYKLVILQSSGKYFLSVSSSLNELLKIELEGFKAGNQVFFKMIALGNEFKCEYSLDNVKWLPCGETLDGKILSTKIAGGFVGAYFGLYAFADSSAKATFDWATYKKIVK